MGDRRQLRQDFGGGLWRLRRIEAQRGEVVNDARTVVARGDLDTEAFPIREAGKDPLERLVKAVEVREPAPVVVATHDRVGKIDQALGLSMQRGRLGAKFQ